MATIADAIAAAAADDPEEEEVEKTPEISFRDESVKLPNGLSMQVMWSLPKKGEGNPEQSAPPSSRKPVLLFLHGSFHASWCWKERFFPFFVSRGYPVVAPSWRGTGFTPASGKAKKVKIQEHVDDLKGLLSILPVILAMPNPKPVIISHSMGGLHVMKYLETHPNDIASRISGVVTVCPVPPSGMGPMSKRSFRRSLTNTWKIISAFPMKRVATNGRLCREVFFGGDKVTLDDGTVDDHGVSDEDLARYMGYFGRDSVAPTDSSDMKRHLPSLKAEKDGRAPFVSSLPPCLVIGARDDFVVDREALEETARYFGLEEPVVVDSPHDVMLGNKWENTATVLHEWLVGQQFAAGK